MSPGNQILALTANNAKANNNTISAGRTVERKKDKGSAISLFILLMDERQALVDARTETTSPAR
tara:strand:+ start:233 stop:424 length:192 start_codon:yes stop_codon:yes gene_type:complete